MIPEGTIRAINEVREAYLGVIRALPEVPSFATLCQTSLDFAGDFQRLCESRARRYVQNPCDGRITAAVIGSSGHGKTTILDEMFPDLAARGWLETDVTDTTSQALKLDFAPPGDPLADEVVVSSWSIAQIKQLMAHPDVVAQNDRDAIEVTYLDDAIVVDGSETTLDERDLAEWRYARRVELRPFERPYDVGGRERSDRKFIRALTVKEQASVLDTGPVIEHEGHSYNALQLRALVESVSLRDPFERIQTWARGASDEGAEQARKLTFIDTPGLAVSSVAKDEVLRHFLGKKSNQIALELLRNDDLDVVVHLVLCGQKSQFDALWNEIERECGRAEMDGLSERLILAVNGMNIYFTNPDIRAKYTDRETTMREGDHFAATLEDNVLQRMSPRGQVRPARIVFLDSHRIVDAFGDYDQFYARHRKTMEEWTEPGSPGHDTLRRLGILESFRENIDALADPDDRGQGYLVRQLVDLVGETGERLLVRKHVVRTGLLDALSGLTELLGRFYDSQGALNLAAAQEALGQCLSFLDLRDPASIDRFAAAQIDPYLDDLVPKEHDDAPENWAEESFGRMAEMVKEAIFEANNSGERRIPAAIQHEFQRAFDEHADGWAKRWGYREVDWPAPPDAAVGTRDLLLHTLRIHAREILFQLTNTSAEAAEAANSGLFQSDLDRETIAENLRTLEAALTTASNLTTATGARR